MVALSGQHRSHAVYELVKARQMELLGTSMGEYLTPVLYRPMPQRVAKFLSKVGSLPFSVLDIVLHN